MTATDINPTDVLAQKRAEAAAPPPKRPAWVAKLASREGRAELFEEWGGHSTWAEPPTGISVQDLWVWVGSRSTSAQRLAEAIRLDPIAVGSMWAEAMKREFDARTEKNQ